MADLAASIAKARKAGYSDAEITAYIAKDPSYGPKVQKAKSAGYNDAEIVGHLGKVNAVVDSAKSLFSGLNEGVAGLADTVIQASPFGMFSSTMQTAANLASNFQRPGEKDKGEAPEKAGLRIAASPFSGATQIAKKQSYQPQTTAGEASRTFGRMIPNAIAPGSVPARLANVVLPTVGAEGAAQFTKAAGGDERAQEMARGVGGVIGGGVASVRPQNLFRQRAPAEALAQRTRQDPAAMTERASAFRQAGVEPALVDVVDDAGRGVIRAAANRPTEGRQVANDLSRSRALNLPDRMSRQSRRLMSDDARTPDQIREAMAARRTANANRQFGAVRGDEVQLSPEGVQALRTDYGRSAIREAARRERDPETRAALNRLAENALDAPATPVSVGMADRVSRVLLGQAQEAGRRGDNDLATTLGDLGRSVRGPTADASPGYRQALNDYAADSQLQEAAGVGERLTHPSTDEFVAAAGGLGDEERQLALAAARRSVERKAGENVSAAPGVARKLADAPEQQTRNAALMGPQRANEFQNAMRSEAQAVENAAAIAPRSGSSTHLNDTDAANAAGFARAGMNLIRGPRGWVDAGLDWLRTRGINNQQAEALVRMAADPARTDEAIRLIQQSLGNAEAQQFLQWRNAGLIGAAAGASGFRAAPEQ